MTTITAIQDQSLQVAARMQRIPVPSDVPEDTSPVEYEGLPLYGPTADEAKTHSREKHARALGSLYAAMERVAGQVAETLWAPAEAVQSAAEMWAEAALSISSWFSAGFGLLTRRNPVVVRVLQSQVSAEVLSFCQRQRILLHLLYSFALIDKWFPTAHTLNAQVDHDPEIGEEWVTLTITVTGETADILDCYDEYTDRWVAAAPSSEVDRIRLCFDVN